MRFTDRLRAIDRGTWWGLLFMATTILVIFNGFGAEYMRLLNMVALLLYLGVAGAWVYRELYLPNRKSERMQRIHKAEIEAALRVPLGAPHGLSRDPTRVSASAAEVVKSLRTPTTRLAPPRAASGPRPRAPLENFEWGMFGLTIGALGVFPLLAAWDVFHSYTPFLLLRMWMVGFAAHGFLLARSAGGVRRIWQPVYLIIGAVFLFVWGLEVEEWMLIDFGTAVLVAVSAIFLRTAPARTPTE